MKSSIPILLVSLSAACTGVSSDPIDEGLSVLGDKHMFVTSETYQGGLLGGLDGADAKCADRAHAAGLIGRYKAWLSDAHASAATRLTHSSGTYSLLDGTLVAASWGDLVRTNLEHAIDLDELHHVYSPPETCGIVGGIAAVWTGTVADGSYTLGPGTECGGWTELQHDGFYGNGLAGNAHASDSHWTDSLCSPTCTDHAALYCIEQ
jgi:hypothetical protein